MTASYARSGPLCQNTERYRSCHPEGFARECGPLLRPSGSKVERLPSLSGQSTTACVLEHASVTLIWSQFHAQCPALGTREVTAIPQPSRGPPRLGVAAGHHAPLPGSGTVNRPAWATITLGRKRPRATAPPRSLEAVDEFCRTAGVALASSSSSMVLHLLLAATITVAASSFRTVKHSPGRPCANAHGLPEARTSAHRAESSVVFPTPHRPNKRRL